LLVVVGPLGAGDGPESLLARVASTTLHALRDGRSVVLLADGAPAMVSRPTDALDWFAGVDPVASATAEQLRAGLQLAGNGAVVVWLGAAMPDAVRTASRAAGAGAVVGAAELAAQATR
jgi:hypothetical protein